ncbi:MAG: uridine kinase [Thermosynechococcaceae cyanobacterium]
MTNPTIIGIGGGSGAGKTTLARAMVERLKGQALILSHDRYYFHMPCGNYDLPEALDTGLMLKHLKALQAGFPVDLPIYDEINSCQKAETERLLPQPTIIVEGIFVLSLPEILKFLDYRIFVQTPSSQRLERRLARDSTEKLRSPSSIIKEWHENVMPTHQSLVEHGATKADLLVSGEDDVGNTAGAVISQLKLTHVRP